MPKAPRSSSTFHSPPPPRYLEGARRTSARLEQRSKASAAPPTNPGPSSRLPAAPLTIRIPPRPQANPPSLFGLPSTSPSKTAPSNTIRLPPRPLALGIGSPRPSSATLRPPPPAQLILASHRLPPPPAGPERAIATKAQRKTCRSALFAAFSASQELFSGLVARSSGPPGDTELESAVEAVFRRSGLPMPVKRGDTLAWLFSVLKDGLHPAPPTAVVHAAHLRARLYHSRRHIRRDFAASVFFFKSPIELGAFRCTVLHVELRKLKQGCEYPTVNHWVALREEDRARWQRYFDETPLADKRKDKGKKFPVILYDETRAQLVIPAAVSCIVRDADAHELVLAVFRGFCANPAILRWAKRVVIRASTTRKSVRLEDAGSIVQVGFSAGALSKPSFGFVRNLLWRGASSDEVERELSSLLTYFWVRAKSIIPEEVASDIDVFYNDCDLPRLNPDWPESNSRTGMLAFPADCGGHSFEDVALAPGCSVLAQRYGRRVHHEHQGHRYALGWTSLREGNVCQGGDFYDATYGICLKMSHDCLFAWVPEHYHTTGLGSFDPFVHTPGREDSDYNQHSIAFVTSSRIKRVFMAWKEKEGLTGDERMRGAVEEYEASKSSDDESGAEDWWCI